MKEMYTPRARAAEIIGERQQDSTLTTRVQEYLGGELPTAKLAIGRVSTYLARYVPDASQQSLEFADQAATDGFEQILWASYLGDQFKTANSEKTALTKAPMNFAKGQYQYANIVPPERREGKLGELQTKFGYSLPEYYQYLRRVVLGENGQADLADSAFDMTDWYCAQAKRFGWDGQSANLAPYYYRAIMALLTVYAALYDVDNSGTDKARNIDFTNNVMYRSAVEVERTLGVKPVVVALETRPDWDDTDLRFLTTQEKDILLNQGSQALYDYRCGILEVR
ncbi:MAG: hypothetical protein LBU20_00975 [Candidatus Nomurabacteria bacterium]|jgi:hypothetical protein|nr:hypothetical protein [Candidatus Nomurabacteria bacterium]